MIEVKWLPRPSAYLPVWEAMRDFTERRDADTPDQIWLVEHEPVYTLGQAGKPVHVLNAGSIDVVHTDRGGQVTYHGPGQVVAYCLVDLRRHGLFVKEYLALLEEVLIAYLDSAGVPALPQSVRRVLRDGRGGEAGTIAACASRCAMVALTTPGA